MLILEILNYLKGYMLERLIIILMLLLISTITYYFNFVDVVYEWSLKKFLIDTPTYFIPTFFLSIIALYIGIKNYWRKVGHSVSGYYIKVSSIYSKDPYISQIILINEKDKPLIVNDVFVKYGRNVNFYMSNFDTPLIIKPYEKHIINYDPVFFYHSSDIHVTNISTLMDKIGKIFLNTSEGIVTVKKVRNYWNPFIESLKHPTFNLIQAQFTTRNESSNIKYLIKYKTLDQENFKHPICYNDNSLSIEKTNIYEINKMNEDQLTIKIKDKINSKELSWESFEIVNVEKKLQNTLAKYPQKYNCSNETFLNFFEYYISYFISKIKNFFQNYSRKLRKNK